MDLYKAKTVYEFYITGENFEEDVERKLSETSYDVSEAINDAMYIYERFVTIFWLFIFYYYFTKSSKEKLCFFYVLIC